MPLLNAFRFDPEPFEPVETQYRTIKTALPVPESTETFRDAARLFPAVNCYQPPVLWDRAEGFQVFDRFGNRWIDFSSTAVTTNTGHGHPKVRERLERHVKDGLLAHFSFLSEIRLELARKLMEITSHQFEKVYLWTTGSEAIESAYRLVHQWARRRGVSDAVTLSIANDYHGCTLAAHQLSGQSSVKPWLPASEGLPPGRIPWPEPEARESAARDSAAGDSGSERQHWLQVLEDAMRAQKLAKRRIAGVFVEAMQGWGALPLPPAFAQALRRWTTELEIPLIFDEVQTGFGRTGKMFAFEHYGIVPDLLCVGKGISSGLPISALLGPADMLDVLMPGEVTTTHAGHPLSCAAALANLEVLEEEQLVQRASDTGELVRAKLEELRARWPEHIGRVSGLGLLNAIHLTDPVTKEPSHALAADLTWQAVRRGVMLFYTNQPTVKICPPLVISEPAAEDGIRGLEEALARLVERPDGSDASHMEARRNGGLEGRKKR